MLASLIIVFREALEAGLIVGIVLAATEGIPGRGYWITGGVLAGLVGAGIVAVFAGALSDMFEGAGQEVFSAAILLFAVIMLGWHILWMSSHAKTMTAELHAVGNQVRTGQRSLTGLAVVVSVAVLREGAEVVLFLFGIVSSTQDGAGTLALGGFAGLVLAAALSWLLYRGLLTIPMRHLFRVTNGLIALLAAGMAATAAGLLHSVDLLPGLGERLWDTGFLIGDNSLAGRALHALIGYTAHPAGIQLAAWLLTLLVLSTAARAIGRPTPLKTAAALVLLLLLPPPARADDLTVVFRDHRFVPDRLVAPAHTKFRLKVTNADAAADEFESSDLNREKLVAPGETVTLFLGPLDPGEYKFFGDFHQDTARGLLVVQ